MKKALQPKPDVCLLLEGTYPYVSGGVSTWVHQIITALPDLRFSLYFIGSEKAQNLDYKYKLPSNVISVEEVYLHDPEDGKSSRRAPELADGVAAELQSLLRQLTLGNPSVQDELKLLMAVSREVMRLAGQRVQFDSFWNDPGTWDLLADLYDRGAKGESFIDFFWSVRALVAPVWRLLAGLGKVPPARMYHSLCTGYSGFIAGVAALQFESIFLLSEHGIYVRERVAEIQKARWIHDTPVIRPDIYRQPGFLRQLWIDFFKLLGRFAYGAANHITSLFEKNAIIQQEFGAEMNKVEIIPNGIHVPDFYQLRGKRRAKKQLTPERRNIGFIGRIVPIKDIKTLLKAARHVCDRMPEAKFLVAGPKDEDPEYAAECDALLEQLSLQQNVTFMGQQNRDDVLPDMDLMLLTSISEGLPFVILEAFAAGIPCVSTDVGACRELIEGRPSEQPNYGPAGLIAPVGNAEQLGDAIVRILADPAVADAMGDAGRARAEAHYSRDAVVRRYRELYQLTPKDFARVGRTTTRQIMSDVTAPVPSVTAARESRAR